MKIKICDVCRINLNKTEEAKYTISLRKGAERISLDACEVHKDFLSKQKQLSISEFNDWYMKGFLTKK